MRNNGQPVEPPPIFEPGQVDEWKRRIIRALDVALKSDPGEVVALPLAPMVESMKRSAGVKPATVTLAVPDDVVVNLRGKPEQVALYALLVVPPAFYRNVVAAERPVLYDSDQKPVAGAGEIHPPRVSAPH